MLERSRGSPKVLMVSSLFVLAAFVSAEAGWFFFSDEVYLETNQQGKENPKSLAFAPKTTDYLFDYEAGYISGGNFNIADGGSSRARILSLNLLPRYQLRKLPGADSESPALSPLSVVPKAQTPTFHNQELFVNGQKSFGVSYSPAGEVDFQQSLSLALRGKLSEKVGFSANISDRNLPSGSGSFSKRLDQFDQLGLSFNFPNGSLNLGDVFFKNSSGNFLNFERKVSGLGFAFGSSNESLAVAFGSGPGEFRTVELPGQEGKQGPYYLGSARSFIVPGSEKVYLDGELLTSGREADYEVDYDRGSITFSPRRPVTAFSRIRIEHEFQSGPYAKNIVAARSTTALAGRKFNLRFGYLGTKDKLDSPLIKGLSNAEKERLAAAGADSSAVVRDGVVFVGSGMADYSAALDSAGNKFYRYAGKNAGDYQVNFSLARGGPGDYRYLGGGVYEYLGKGKGAYLPVLYLPVPTADGGASLGLEYSPKNFLSFLEFSLSEANRNLFSRQAGVKSTGSAFLGGMRWQNSDSPALKLEAKLKRREADFRYLGKKETNEAAYRWNLLPGEESLGQTEGEVSLAANWGWGESRFGLSGLSLENKRKSGLGESELSLSPASWLTLKSKTEAGRSNSAYGHYRTKSSATGRWGHFILSSTVEREKANPFLGQNLEIRQRWSHKVEYQTYFLEGAYGSRAGFGGPAPANLRPSGWGVLSRFFEFRLGSSPIHLGDHFSSEGSLTWRRTKENRKQINRAYLFLKSNYLNSGWRASFAHELLPVESPLEINSYLDVGRGNGSYRYENGGYVSDPYGNFDLISETAGETLTVSRVRQNWELAWEPYRHIVSRPNFWSQVSWRAVFNFDADLSGRRPSAHLLPVFSLSQSRRHELEFRQTVSYLPASRKLRMELSWSEKGSRRSYLNYGSGAASPAALTDKNERKIEAATTLYGQRLTQSYSAGYSCKNSGAGFWAPYRLQGMSLKGEWWYAFNPTLSASLGSRFYGDRELKGGRPTQSISFLPKLVFSFPNRGRAEAGLTTTSVSGSPVSYEQAEGNLKGLNLDYNLNFEYRLGPKLSASASFFGSQRPRLGKTQRASTHLSYLF